MVSEGPQATIEPSVDLTAARRGARQVTSAPGVTSDDLRCPICVDTLVDPFVTSCGHTFCYQCISTHLRNRKNCPSCSHYLTNDLIFPNFLLSKILGKAVLAQSGQASTLAGCVQQVLQGGVTSVHVSDLDAVIEMLVERREQLVQHEATTSLQLMLLFLQEARRRKEAELTGLNSQLNVLDRDLSAVRSKQAKLQQQHQQSHQWNHVRSTQPVQSVMVVPTGNGAMQAQLRSAAATAIAAAANAGAHVHVTTLREGLTSTITLTPQVAAAAAAAAAGPSTHFRNSTVQNLAAALGFQMNPSTLPGRQQESERTDQRGQQLVAPHLPHPLSPGPQGLDGVTRVQHKRRASSCTNLVRLHDEYEGQGAGAGAGAGGEGAQPPQRPQGHGGQASPPPDTAQRHVTDGHQAAARVPGRGIRKCASQPAFQVLPDPEPPGPGAPPQAADGGGAGATRTHAQLNGGHHLPASLPAAEEEGEGMSGDEGVDGGGAGDLGPLVALREAKKRRILSQFEELQEVYLRMRSQAAHDTGTPTTQLQAGGPGPGGETTLGLEPLLQHLVGSKRDRGGALATAPGPAAGPGPSGLHSSAPQRGVAPGGEALPGPRGDQGGSGSEAGGGQGRATTRDTQPGSSTGAAVLQLQRFSQVLSGATHYSRVTVLGEVSVAGAVRGSGDGARGGGGGRSSSMIPCIELDVEEHIFATCCAQRIHLWNYDSVVSHPPGEAGAPPAAELVARTKLTALSFSHHSAQTLAVSDSEGAIWLYDVTTQQLVSEYEAHNKRVWALDFAPAVASSSSSGGGSSASVLGPSGHVWVSGSDDYTVKVWTPSSPNPVASIGTRANVCSVRFCPWDPNYLAVGSAAHSVLLYDLRMLGHSGAASAPGPAAVVTPVATMTGHRKAVSYVRWAGPHELVSASTDSTLRLWDVRTATTGTCPPPEPDLAPPCVSVYSGHSNERNFVGLAVHGDLLAAGSEKNEVVFYYKPMPTPSMRHLLSQPRHNPGTSSHNQFVSSLTWRSSSSTLLAANSQGSVSILALV